MTATLVRPLDFDNLILDAGEHAEQVGFCVMEAVSWVAGEEWSDHPQCACPVIAAFMRRWNDDLDQETRQKLKPYIVRLVGTKSTAAVESKRAWLATDWLCRVHLPAWLELAGLNEHATVVRNLPPLDSSAASKAAQPTLNVAREKSAAACDAAKDAAKDAAWAAAGDAAWAAAWDAAREKLKPTTVSLQASAFDLLDRMIDCGKGT